MYLSQKKTFYPRKEYYKLARSSHPLKEIEVNNSYYYTPEVQRTIIPTVINEPQIYKENNILKEIHVQKQQDNCNCKDLDRQELQRYKKKYEQEKDKNFYLQLELEKLRIQLKNDFQFQHEFKMSQPQLIQQPAKVEIIDNTDYDTIDLLRKATRNQQEDHLDELKHFKSLLQQKDQTIEETIEENKQRIAKERNYWHNYQYFNKPRIVLKQNKRF